MEVSAIYLVKLHESRDIWKPTLLRNYYFRYIFKEFEFKDEELLINMGKTKELLKRIFMFLAITTHIAETINPSGQLDSDESGNGYSLCIFWRHYAADFDEFIRY